MRNTSKSLHRLEDNNTNNAYGTVRNYTSLFIWVCFCLSAIYYFFLKQHWWIHIPAKAVTQSFKRIQIQTNKTRSIVWNVTCVSVLSVWERSRNNPTAKDISTMKNYLLQVDIGFHTPVKVVIKADSIKDAEDHLYQNIGSDQLVSLWFQQNPRNVISAESTKEKAMFTQLKQPIWG